MPVPLAMCATPAMPARPHAARHPPGRRAALLALALLLAAGGAWLPRRAAAHEMGPFQVFGTFRADGSFQLDVKVDDEHLPGDRMGGPAHATRYGRIAGLRGPAEQRFGRFLSDLADSLTLRFDGAPVAPTLRMDPEAGGDPAAPARVTMLVSGWTPGGARTFTLESALPVKSFPVVLTCEGDDTSSWKWVDGGSASPPYKLAPRVVPPPRTRVMWQAAGRGFAGVLPHGPLPLLAVAALFLLARRLGPALVLVALFALGGAAGVAWLALHGTAVLSGVSGVSGSAGFAGGPLQALVLAALALAGALAPPGSWRRRWPALLVAGAVCAAGAVFGLGSGAAAAPGGASASVAPAAIAAAAGSALGALAAELTALAACALLCLPLTARPWYRRRVVVPAGCLMAVVALYWSLAALVAA